MGTKLGTRTRRGALASLLAAATIWGTGTASRVAVATEDTAPERTTLTVRGGWFNDSGCIPVGVTPRSEPFEVDITCTGGSLWDGDLTGRTVVHALLTMDEHGNQSGTFEELFVGMSPKDNTTGGLHTAGTFTIDKHGAFNAVAEIVSGTCAWAGSTGSITYDGNAFHGGFVGTWSRPVGTVADPTCVPADRLPG